MERTPTVTVVVCAYTEDRWSDLMAALGSIERQRHQPEQCVLVVDHNERLLGRAREAFPEVEVVPNAEVPGLSGARNTGILLARGDVVAFLDDDAQADAGWLEELLAVYEDPAVAGAGGLAIASWPKERPAWFPPEFDWVVGCSYVGLPETSTPVRNLMGAAMSFRRTVFDEVGPFDTAMGRLGANPVGCEETEFSIRLGQQLTGSVLMQVATATVSHTVSAVRATPTYFVRRCFAEGSSKAAVAQRLGASSALVSERRYATRALPSGVARGVAEALHGDAAGLARAAMIVIGLAVTTLGYLAGRLGFDARRKAASSRAPAARTTRPRAGVAP